MFNHAMEYYIDGKNGWNKCAYMNMAVSYKYKVERKKKFVKTHTAWYYFCQC